MSEMVERVARAMYAHDSYKEGEPAWEDHSEQFRVVQRARARVAIEAMREPTEEMYQAGWGRGGTPDVIWPAMIDAALAK